MTHSLAAISLPQVLDGALSWAVPKLSLSDVGLKSFAECLDSDTGGSGGQDADLSDSVHRGGRQAAWGATARHPLTSQPGGVWPEVSLPPAHSAALLLPETAPPVPQLLLLSLCQGVTPNKGLIRQVLLGSFFLTTLGFFYLDNSPTREGKVNFRFLDQSVFSQLYHRFRIVLLRF